MNLREQMQFMDTRDFQELNRVPEWARAEHMEMSTPLKELWNYPDFFEKVKHNRFTQLLKKKKATNGEEFLFVRFQKRKVAMV